MKRFILDELRKWKDSKRRKPLILRGARQVGKTWALEEFGKDFSDGFVNINFDKNPEFKHFFETTKDIKRIISNIEVVVGHKITKETLVIFDEIQACPAALNSLKYFCEDAPEYYVVSAGSLLGITLSEGFPVGKVDFLDMGPMNFKEFLLALGYSNYVEYIDSIDSIEAIPLAFHDLLIEKLKMYFVVGGMPEAVKVFIEDGNIKKVDEVLDEILDSYESDFGKHAPNTDVPKIRLIWKSMPSQLAKENKKFIYNVVKEGARAREYENALNWLCNANLLYKTSKISKPAIPMSRYEDLSCYKIYFGDVGLLRKHSRLASSAFIEENRLFTDFKGALAENFVLQSIERAFDNIPYYWANLNYEVDFLVQKENDIFPVEVKAGINVSASSIKQYIKNYDEVTRFGIRLSLKNLAFDGKILNVPLYLVDRLADIIEIAKRHKDIL